MKNKTTANSTLIKIITAVDIVESAIIEDRSNDPEYGAQQRENLKKLGICGRWKVIRTRGTALDRLEKVIGDSQERDLDKRQGIRKPNRTRNQLSLAGEIPAPLDKAQSEPE